MTIHKLLRKAREVQLHKTKLHDARRRLECIQYARTQDITEVRRRLAQLESSHARMSVASANLALLQDNSPKVEHTERELKDLFSSIDNIISSVPAGMMYFRLRDKNLPPLDLGSKKYVPIHCLAHEKMLRTLLKRNSLPECISQLVCAYAPPGFVQLRGSKWDGQQASTSIYVEFNHTELHQHVTLNRFKIVSNVAPHVRDAHTYRDWRRIRKLQAKLEIEKFTMDEKAIVNAGFPGKFLVYQQLNSYTGNVWAVTPSAKDQENQDAIVIFKIPTRLFKVERGRTLKL